MGCQLFREEWEGAAVEVAADAVDEEEGGSFGSPIGCGPETVEGVAVGGFSLDELELQQEPAEMGEDDLEEPVCRRNAAGQNSGTASPTPRKKWQLGHE